MLTEDGKTVARAIYGRYYQPISVESLRRFGPDMPQVQRTVPALRGRAVEHRRHQRRRGDRHGRERARLARRIYGLTPISEELQTIDPRGR